MNKKQIKEIQLLDLNIFEEKLHDMAVEGDLDIDLSRVEPTFVSDEEFNLFHNSARRASHENVLIEASQATNTTELPLGRYLHTIRNRSGLSQEDIAWLLNKDDSFVENIESGQLNPLKLLVKDIVDIMQVFRLTLSELTMTLKASLSLSKVKPKKLSAMARSTSKVGTKEKGDSLSHAVDATLQAIAKNSTKTQDEPDINEIKPGYIESIAELLKKRGEESLLI